MTSKLLLLFACALCAACGGGADGAATIPAYPTQAGGHLLLIGGGKKPEPVMRHFVHLAGGSEARIVVLPMASGDSREAGADYVDLFGALGAHEVTVLHVDDRRDAENVQTMQKVREAGGVFFTGGDQRRITQRILDTPLLDALMEMKRRGGVVGGTSAGTACQSDPMLTGDGDTGVLRADNIVLARGLGLFPDVILDQHFVARQRQNRLLSVVLQHPDRLGIGVDEATAVWLRPDGLMEVLGEGWVQVYDARAGHMARGGDAQLGATGVRMHVLLAGQRFDLQLREPVQASGQAQPPGD